MVQTNAVGNIKHTFYVECFFSSENRSINEIIWKNVV